MMNHRMISIVLVGFLSTSLPSASAFRVTSMNTRRVEHQLTELRALRDRNDQFPASNWNRNRHNNLHNTNRVQPSRRSNPTRISQIPTHINRTLPKYSVPNNDNSRPDDSTSTPSTSSPITSSSVTTRKSTTDDVTPPPNFDPRQFDNFEEGEWSTNINNPFVAAKYVRFRRAASVTSDDDVTQSLHDSVEEEAAKKRKDAWVQARELEDKAEQLRKEMMMGMNGGIGSSGGGKAMEEAAKKRMEAWNKSQEQE